jgi:hypothetical protein
MYGDGTGSVWKDTKGDIYGTHYQGEKKKCNLKGSKVHIFKEGSVM